MTPKIREALRELGEEMRRYEGEHRNKASVAAMAGALDRCRDQNDKAERNAALAKLAEEAYLEATSSIEKVRSFMEAFNQKTPGQPSVPDIVTVLLRFHLYLEELSELALAMASGDKIEMLDAFTDIQYVHDGAMLACGMGKLKDKAFDLVHQSNMAKLVDGKPILNEAGRVSKPAGWQAPDLASLFQDEGTI